MDIFKNLDNKNAQTQRCRNSNFTREKSGPTLGFAVTSDRPNMRVTKANMALNSTFKH